LGKDIDMSDMLSQVFEAEDLYYVTLLMMYLLKDDSRYSLLSELFLIMDKQSFLNLLVYFEDQYIKIPSRDELLRYIRLILLYYHYDMQSMNWKEALEKSGFSHEEDHFARKSLSSIREYLKDYKIPKWGDLE